MNTINLNTIGEAPVKKVVAGVGDSNSGGGVPIVNSVDELNPNSPMGSLACVIEQGSIQKTSFRDLYQVDTNILDYNTYTFNTENCSLVGGLAITPPAAPIESSSPIMLMFSTANLSMMSSDGIMVQLQFVPNSDNTKLIGLAGAMMDYATKNQINYTLFSINDDGSVTVNHDQIDAINEVFANNELYYLGTFMYVLEGGQVPSDFYDVVDTSIYAVSDPSSKAHVYLKQKTWKELYAKDLEKLTSNLDKVEESVKTKAEKIDILAQKDNSYRMYIDPNKYCRYKVDSNNQDLVFVLKSSNNQYYEEYIIEIVNKGGIRSISFKDSNDNNINVTWANGTAPTFDSNMTYLISIANGFGVYTKFPNS